MEMELNFGMNREVKLKISAMIRIDGSGGSLTLTDPWVPCFDGGETALLLERNGEEIETIRVTAPPLYAIEADFCAGCILKGDRQASSPAMSWADTIGNIRMQDEWRRAMDAPAPFTLTRPAPKTRLR